MPGKTRFGKRLRAAVITAAALCFLIALFWPVRCLTLTSGGALLYARAIRPGDSFEITFTHSLNLSPITDVVEWTGGELIVRKSIFRSFGAGVPVPSDGIGTELVRREDGGYELIGIDKRMDRITILTQKIPNHKITFGADEVYLLELLGPEGTGRQVDIEVRLVPRMIIKYT